MLTIRPARLIARTMRAFAQTIAVVLGLLLFVCALVILQGQRDETRPAGAVLVLDAARGPGDAAAQAQLDRALALHRRGMVQRILLSGGEQAEQSLRYLAERGATGDAVFVSSPGASMPERLAHVAEATRIAGVESLVIVAEPWELMRALKITRDFGLSAYGSPARIIARGRSPLDDARSILRESWGYLSYVFVGR